ncbi:esterase-like activity of phytase family protein [Phenylobacterium sp.]|uniref:esterase-like activity of phytase family protein n=1 Tax=Phenylobacterium sp. TaxID=1871053 RepID=UPI002EDAFE2B
MRRRAGLLAALSLAACAPQVPDRLPTAPLPYGAGISITAEPAGPAPGTTMAPGWAFAGGYKLNSAETSRLHGLSDIKVWPDGRLLAVGDQGDLLEARLTFDAKGWLAGVADATLKPVLGEDGQPITSQGDREYDAEGIAEFPDGSRLISLEQHDRVYFYPKGQTTPRPAPMPGISIVFNKGMEALAAWPAGGADGYLLGVEGTGEVFRCRVTGACTAYGRVDLEGLELTALAPLPTGGVAYLLRGYNPLAGNRIIIKVIGADGREVDRLQIARPQVVDNFEGLAAVKRGDGVRFYLLSDDNFNSTQQTLLFAVDWTPPP